LVSLYVAAFLLYFPLRHFCFTFRSGAAVALHIPTFLSNFHSGAAVVLSVPALLLQITPSFMRNISLLPARFSLLNNVLTQLFIHKRTALRFENPHVQPASFNASFINIPADYNRL
jgi:hypothetical protein